MSLWSKIVRLFGGGAGGPEETPSTSSGAGDVPDATSSLGKGRTQVEERQDALDAQGILGLSQEELRTRALRINPYQTAWIGRVDTIPPQSDERTALIDRGLILRGLLTKAELDDIHRIGDQWLLHHDAKSLILARAHASVDAFLAEQRKQKAARKEEKRRASLQLREARQRAKEHRHATDIVFAGQGVSHGLSDQRSMVEALAARNLPVLSSPKELSGALGLSVSRLRWLVFHRDVATRTHYVYFEVPKRTGGTRLLAAPHRELKAAQRWIARNILERLETHDAAHGFVRERSVVSNASAHVGRDVVIRCDLKDFFPTIGFVRVRGLFRAIGYSPSVSTLLALLCTEAPRVATKLDGRMYWVATTGRTLPQGAPTSPALSNQIARTLDCRLRGVARKLGFTYTRYADDLSFSAPEGRRDRIGRLLAHVHRIAKDEGFHVHPNKTHVAKASARQSVTGVVVNERASLPREDLRRLRAILHRARETGYLAQNRIGHADFGAYLRGKLAYVRMIDPEKGRKLLEEFDRLRP